MSSEGGDSVRDQEDERDGEAEGEGEDVSAADPSLSCIAEETRRGNHRSVVNEVSRMVLGSSSTAPYGAVAQSGAESSKSSAAAEIVDKMVGKRHLRPGSNASTAEPSDSEDYELDHRRSKRRLTTASHHLNYRE